MKTPPVPVLTLVIGLALGFLATRTLDSRSHSDSENSPSSAQNASRIPKRPGSADSKSSKRSKTTVGGARASGKLAKLLNLTSPYHAALPSHEFSQAIKSLDLGQIMGILAELEATADNDPRAYKIRNALYGHWAETDPAGAWTTALEIKKRGIRGQALSAVIGAISQHDLSYAKTLISELKSGREKQSVLHAFIGVAASENPKEVYDFIKEHLDSHNSYQLHSLFHTWAKNDPDGAISQLKTLKGNRDRQQALSAIANSLAAENPDRAIEFAMSLKNKNESRNTLNTVIGGIASNDPQQALKFVEALPNGPQRNNALGNIASSWIQNDPDAALAWINTLPDADRLQAMQQGMHQIISSDAVAAAELLDSLPPGNHISHYYSQLASQWVQTDPDAAMTWIKGLSNGQLRSQASNGIISSLSQNDPRKAAEFIAEIGIDRNSSYQIGNIVSNWAATDRSAALEWMEGLELRGEVRRNAMSSMVSQLVQQDPEGTSTYVLSLTDPKDRETAIQSLLGGWARNDPENAHDWINTHLDGDSKNKAMNSLIQNLSHQNIQSAVAYYDEAISNLSSKELEKNFSNTASQLIGNWAQYDPTGASEWLNTLPEGNQRTNALYNLVNTWAYNDVAGAAEFVLTLNNGNERDRAVESLVQRLRDNDPQAAFQWAESIDDQQKRDQSVRQAVNQWKESDPDAARAAVNAADISDKMRQRILKGLDK